MVKRASPFFLLIIIVVKGFEVAAYQKRTSRDYSEVKYKGPVVYSNLPPPVLYFPSLESGSKASSDHDDPESFLYDPEQVDRSERNIEYVPLPYQDLPVLVYQSNHNPPIHVVNKEKKDDSLSKEFWLGRKSETTSRSSQNHKQYDDSEELNSQQHSRQRKSSGSNVHNLSILPDHEKGIKQKNFAEEYQHISYLTSPYEKYKGGSGDRLQEYTFPLSTQLEEPLGSQHFENGDVFNHGDLNAPVAQWAYAIGEREKYVLNSNPDEFNFMSHFGKSQNDYDKTQSKQTFERGEKLSFQHDSNPKDGNFPMADSVGYFVHDSPAFEDSSFSTKGIISSMAPRRYGYFQQQNSQTNYDPFQSTMSLPETFLFRMNQGSHHSAKNPDPKSATVNLKSIYYGNQRAPLNLSAMKDPRVQESLLDFSSVVRPVYVSTFGDVDQTNARYPSEEAGKVFRGVPNESRDVDSSQQSKEQQDGKFESVRAALTVFPSHSTDLNQRDSQELVSSQVKPISPKNVKGGQSEVIRQEKTSDSHTLSNQRDSQTLPYIVYTGHPPIHVFQHPIVQKVSKRPSEKSLPVDAENDESKVSIGSSHKAVLPNIDNKATAFRIPMQKPSGTDNAPNPLQENSGPKSSNRNAQVPSFYPKIQDSIQPVIIPLDFDRFIVDGNSYKTPNLSLRPQSPTDVTQVNSVSPDTLLRRLKLSGAYRGLLSKLASLGSNILVGTLKIQPQHYPQALSTLYLGPGLQSSNSPVTQNKQDSTNKQHSLGSSQGKSDKSYPKAAYKVPTTRATAAPRHRKPPIIIYKGLQPPVHVYDSDINPNKPSEYDQRTRQTNLHTQTLSDSSGIGTGPQRVFSIGELSSLFRQPIHEIHSGEFSDSLFLQDYQPFFHHGSDYRSIEKRVEHDPTERASHSDSSDLSASSWVPINFPHYTQAESISDVIVPVISEEKSNGYALDQIRLADNSESSRDVSKEGSKDSLISKTDVRTVDEKI